ELVHVERELGREGGARLGVDLVPLRGEELPLPAERLDRLHGLLAGLELLLLLRVPGEVVRARGRGGLRGEEEEEGRDERRPLHLLRLAERLWKEPSLRIESSS